MSATPDAPPDVLAVHAQTQADAIAVIVDGSGGGTASMATFGELNAVVNRLANGLYDTGARAGERLVWCGPNSLEVLATIHAARKLGLVAVPLSYRFTAEEMAYVIDNSDATTVVVDAEQAPLVAEIRDQIPKVRTVVVFGGPTPAGCTPWDDLLAGQPDTEPAAIADPSEAGAAMIYTSGTTGKPKGALRTQTDRALVFALLAELNLLHEHAVHLTTGPLYHSGPLAFASLSHTLGAPIVVLRKFDAARWVELVKEHRVTNTFSAPTQLKRIVSLPGRRARERRHVVDGHADRQRGAGSLHAEAGDHRQARRRLPLRGVRLDRARRRHRPQARGPAPQAGIVRQAVRRHRDPHRHRRRRHRRAERAGRAVRAHRRSRWTATTAPSSS